MSNFAKILSLSYDSAVATKTSALKTYYRSVRLIKDAGTVNPKKESYVTNVLLCGNCIDKENRNLYVFYIDTYYSSAWIIEINIDTRVQKVVYYDKYNAIGFDPLHKIYNASVVHGRLIWTDGLNPIYQMDIERAKRSFYYKIGYGQYPNTSEWSAIRTYSVDEIVSSGNYFYKSLIDNNIGEKPKNPISEGVSWNKLCLIEDAYYSMNIKNFYFEPIPPSHPPDVTYFSDDTRKINNLRQTLFQIAYGYVYMDWRKSTFSPASIVPVPQAEEETTTGLANEQISLNNKLQIVVNSGGEEVRAVEIIGRSNRDPSKWFLIETIEKITAEERGNEISRRTELPRVDCFLAVMAPTVINSVPFSDNPINMLMTVIKPFIINSWIEFDVVEMFFAYSVSGIGFAQETVITCPSFGIATAFLESMVFTPTLEELTLGDSWIIIEGYVPGYHLNIGNEVANGITLKLYPWVPNYSVERSCIITFANIYGDKATIAVTQREAVAPPSCSVLIAPLDGSGMVIDIGTADALNNSNTVDLFLSLDHPSYAPGEEFSVYWRATVNGTPQGEGWFTVHDEVMEPETRTITLPVTLTTGDVVVIYLSGEIISKITIDQIALGLFIHKPNVISSSVSFSDTSQLWLHSESGIGIALLSDITALPVKAFLASKVFTPTLEELTIEDWLTIWGYEQNFNLPILAEVYNGITLSLFPWVPNYGGERTCVVTFANEYGDSATITVVQQANPLPPGGIPIDATAEEDTPAHGLDLLNSNVLAFSGSKDVSLNIMVDVTGYYDGEPVAVHWRALVNGVLQGYSYFMVENNTYDQLADIVLNSDLLSGDVLVIYLSGN